MFLLLWKSVAFPQKIKDRAAMGPSNPAPGYALKGIESGVSNRPSHPSVDGSMMDSREPRGGGNPSALIWWFSTRGLLF
jgi:hypothetical protein